MTLDNLRYALILSNKALLDRLKPFMHKHDNLPTLNGLGVDDNDHLLFQGNLVNEQYEVTDAEIEKIVDEVMSELDKSLGDNSGNTGSGSENNDPEPPEESDQSPVTPIGITITQQPEDIAVEQGQVGTVTIEATGNGLTYQWYGVKADGNPAQLGETPTYSGSNTDTLSVTVSDSFVDQYGEDGKLIYCVITDADGNTVTSNTITVSVIENET